VINPSNIGEWIREVEERPESAPLIIREIANRLIELDRLNEKLRAENMELSTGLKVYQYKDKIAELEYQLEILSRQLDPAAIVYSDTLNLLIYNQRSQLLKLEFSPNDLTSGASLATLKAPETPAAANPRLLVVSPKEELLLMFDSGRVTPLPVESLPLAEKTNLNWAAAHTEDLRSDRELVTIMPIGKMASFDQLLQVSRRGHARKITRSFFQKYISQGNIGKGIDLSNPMDAPLALTLANETDLFVIVTRQGYVLGLPGSTLPVAGNRVIKLDPDDSVITAFILREGQSLVVVTQEGRAVRFESSWVKPAAGPGGRGQPIWAKSKVTAGIQVVGAAAAHDDDWGLGLKQDGGLVAIKIGDIPISKSNRIEQPLKNIYPFDLAAFTIVPINNL
jgi:DNA gyrase/topoisomerase IV subunit A